MESFATFKSPSMKAASSVAFVRRSSPVILPQRNRESVSYRWQGELKYGASRLVRVGPQPTPMGVDDGATDQEAHSNPAGLGRVKSFENAIEMFRIDARPGIAYGDQDAIPLALLAAD